MKTYIPFLSILFFTIINFTSVSSQQNNTFIIPDTLKKMSYYDLYYKIQKSKDHNFKIMYANTYLCIAEKENNSKEIINGSIHLLQFYDLKNRMLFIDKMISISKSKYPDLLAYFYYKKGDLLFEIRKIKPSLEYLLDALKFVDKNNLDLLYSIKYLTAVVRSSQGYYLDALPVFLECEKYYKKNPKSNEYLVSICALSETYNRLDKIEKAEYYTQLGLQLSKKTPIFFNPYYFISCRGKDNYKKQKFNNAIADLKSTLPFLKNEVKDFSNYSENCFYIGRSYQAIKQNEKALIYFKKVDSVFVKENDIYPSIVNAYKPIISHYKSKGDLKKQLYYTQQLIKADSVVESIYNFITKKIHKEYDIPLIISEKEIIIQQLHNESTFSNLKIFGLISIVFLLIIVLLYYNSRQKKYRVNFEKLLLSHTSKVEMQHEVKQVTTNSTLDDIPQNTVIDIENKLFQFEKKLGFLAKDCNLTNMAKSFSTNYNYLSKIINIKKGSSFPIYINNLRIDYAVKLLKEDKIYLTHSIEGIASEVGFSNTQSFSKAFLNRTGIKPSFFIKELKIRK
jgi:AraC-like DNA-binding protein